MKQGKLKRPRPPGTSHCISQAFGLISPKGKRLLVAKTRSEGEVEVPQTAETPSAAAAACLSQLETFAEDIAFVAEMIQEHTRKSQTYAWDDSSAHRGLVDDLATSVLGAARSLNAPKVGWHFCVAFHTPPFESPHYTSLAYYIAFLQ